MTDGQDADLAVVEEEVALEVDLEACTVLHPDGWLFRVVPAFGASDPWEVICVEHPEPVTEGMTEEALELAELCQQVFAAALAGRH